VRRILEQKGRRGRQAIGKKRGQSCRNDGLAAQDAVLIGEKNTDGFEFGGLCLGHHLCRAVDGQPIQQPGARQCPGCNLFFDLFHAILPVVVKTVSHSCVPIGTGSPARRIAFGRNLAPLFLVADRIIGNRTV
jgi:hypothetical protein